MTFPQNPYIWHLTVINIYHIIINLRYLYITLIITDIRDISKMVTSTK